MDASFIVTNGSVAYERKKQPVDYEHIHPMVTLHFTVADGSDPAVVTSKVMAMAMAAVENALSGSVSSMREAPVIVPDNGAPVPATRRPRATAPTTPAPVPEAPAHTLVAPAPVSATASGGSLIDEPEPVIEAPDAHDMAGVDSDDEDELLGIKPSEDQPAAVVTDADLQKLAMPLSEKLRKKEGTIGKLRALIADAGGGSNLINIPQENRAVFVEKAKGLSASLA